MADDKLFVRVPEAAAMLSLGRTTIYRLIDSGELPTVHVGRSIRISARAVRAYAELLEAEQHLRRLG